MLESMPRIKQLPSLLADQIAAGEVIERPGAALKEILENSIDAKATTIRVEIEGGGVTRLAVHDNGIGILKEDLPLTISRHATSKVFDNLDRISTLGFRGEALAAIAAVARVSIASRPAIQNLAYQLKVEAGKILAQNDIARGQGTSVIIQDLFCSVPARKAFLRSQASETNYCLQAFHRLAMANPQIHWEANIDNKRKFIYRAQENEAERILDFFAQAQKTNVTSERLIPFAQESEDLKVHGWMLPTNMVIPSSKNIFTFVNGRMVKDKLIQQAILQSVKEVLFGNMYPQLAIFLDVDFTKVDVNVHPTKAELRFQDPGKIFSLVRKAVSQAIQAHQNPIHRVEPKYRNAHQTFADPQSTTAPQSTTGQQSTFFAQTQTMFQQKARDAYHHQGTPISASLTNTWANTSTNASLPHANASHPHTNASLPHANASPSPPTNASPSPPTNASASLSASSPTAMPPHADQVSAAASYRSSEVPQFLGTVKNTYIVCQDSQGMILIDQHAAHERVMYEKLRRSQNLGEAMHLLVPLGIELSEEEVTAFEPYFKELDEQGLTLEKANDTHIKVKALPALLLRKNGSPKIPVGTFVRNLARNLEPSDEPVADVLRKEVLDTVASQSCHGSVRAGQALSSPEAENLMLEMQTTNFAGHCPHGRPTAIRLDWADLETMFKRTL